MKKLDMNEVGLGLIISKIRKELGISRGEFAGRADITQSYMSLIETNIKIPNRKLQLKLERH